MCSSEAEVNADGSVATGRFTNAGQASSEGQQTVPHNEEHGGLLKRLLQSLGEHTSKSKPAPTGFGWHDACTLIL